MLPSTALCSLEKPETLASGEVLAAMCHLLSLVLSRVPNQILRAKFAASSQVLCSILEAKQVGGWRPSESGHWLLWGVPLRKPLHHVLAHTPATD
jgi:hypothetical protein